MSTSSTGELLALAARIASVSWKASYTGIVLLGHERDMIVSALRLAASPKAGVDREVIARIVDPALFGKYDREIAAGSLARNGKPWADVLFGAHIDAVLAKADAIVSALLPSVLGGVDQPRIATKPTSSRTEASASETSGGEFYMPNGMRFYGAVRRDEGSDTHYFIDGDFAKIPLRRSPAVAKTDAVAPDNAGLVSGGER